ncbi:hypothetical protein [Brucella intermedia]|uniref:hypothetical protein n=1 Tax=Brucella intermedia TaxID=94625 RepID=UPI0012D3622D|nr:hypothetical protein [Brucella intermedia]
MILRDKGIIDTADHTIIAAIIATTGPDIGINCTTCNQSAQANVSRNEAPHSRRREDHAPTICELLVSNGRAIYSRGRRPENEKSLVAAVYQLGTERCSFSAPSARDRA